MLISFCVGPTSHHVAVHDDSHSLLAGFHTACARRGSSVVMTECEKLACMCGEKMKSHAYAPYIGVDDEAVAWSGCTVGDGDRGLASENDALEDASWNAR